MYIPLKKSHYGSFYLWTYFIWFSACSINFLTMLPPILPASLEEIFPLYPSFKVTPTSEATSYLNLLRASLAYGITFI